MDVRKMGWCGDAAEADSLESDDFEVEMEAELERRAGLQRKEAGLAEKEEENKKEVNPEPEKPYEEVYFDSDEEDGDTKTNRRAKVTDEDLLYDPNMDDEDQAYVDNLRRSFRPDLKGSHLGKAKDKAKAAQKLPSSDAVLNCPACFNVVCLDCQRHAVYKSQYRAMFVMNCSVDKGQKLKFPLQGEKKKGKGKKSSNSTLKVEDEEDFNPVKCEQCSTEIGVLDKDQVYHFFNVMASYS